MIHFFTTEVKTRNVCVFRGAKDGVEEKVNEEEGTMLVWGGLWEHSTAADPPRGTDQSAHAEENQSAGVLQQRPRRLNGRVYTVRAGDCGN